MRLVLVRRQAGAGSYGKPVLRYTDTYADGCEKMLVLGRRESCTNV